MRGYPVCRDLEFGCSLRETGLDFVPVGLGRIVLFLSHMDFNVSLEGQSL